MAISILSETGNRYYGDDGSYEMQWRWRSLTSLYPLTDFKLSERDRVPSIVRLATLSQN